MAAFLLHSSISLCPSRADSWANRSVGRNWFPPKAFLSHGSTFLSVPRVPSRGRRATKGIPRCEASYPTDFNHILNQFRGENPKDEREFYGLPTSQMHFTTKGGLIARQAEKTTRESISATRSYMNHDRILCLKDVENDLPTFNSGLQMSAKREEDEGPSSTFFQQRTIYLGWPIIPRTADAIVGQLLLLDLNDASKPIYFYINSSRTLDEDNEVVASEINAYAIADMMAVCRSKIYTINVGMAFGQAAMLLSLGEKGHRYLTLHAATRLCPPKCPKFSGSSTKVWIKAQELEAFSNSYIKLLSKGTGKSVEELAKDVAEEKFFPPEAAIEYGLADKILTP